MQTHIRKFAACVVEKETFRCHRHIKFRNVNLVSCHALIVSFISFYLIMAKFKLKIFNYVVFRKMCYNVMKS